MLETIINAYKAPFVDLPTEEMPSPRELAAVWFLSALLLSRL